MVSASKALSNNFSTQGPRPQSVPNLWHRKASERVREILSAFIERLNFCPEGQIAETNSTYLALHAEFSAYNDGGEWFNALCRESSTMAELSYPNHSAQERLLIARFTWFLIYIDDLGQKFPSSLENFQNNVLKDVGTQGAFLDAFRDHLTDLYQYWDAIPANCITLAALDYINGCLLEEIPSIRNMKLTDAAVSWPYFLRNKTGSSAAFSFMLFPKASKIEMSVYIQVMDDLILFTNLLNDIMSFYKEYLAGERNNYVYNRANVTGKDIFDTLQDVVNDTLAAHARITKVLEKTEADNLWKCYVNGYLAFHNTLKRYRLNNLGF